MDQGNEFGRFESQVSSQEKIETFKSQEDTQPPIWNLTNCIITKQQQQQNDDSDNGGSRLLFTICYELS